MFFGIFVLNRVSFLRQEPITLFLEYIQPAGIFYECLKLGIKNQNSCLKQGRKISDFCLKQGQGMRGRAAPPHPRIYRVAPPRDFYIRIITCAFIDQLDSFFDMI